MANNGKEEGQQIFGGRNVNLKGSVMDDCYTPFLYRTECLV